MWNHIRAPPFMENDPRSGSAVSDNIVNITMLAFCNYVLPVAEKYRQVKG